MVCNAGDQKQQERNQNSRPAATATRDMSEHELCHRSFCSRPLSGFDILAGTGIELEEFLSTHVIRNAGQFVNL